MNLTINKYISNSSEWNNLDGTVNLKSHNVMQYINPSNISGYLFNGVDSYMEFDNLVLIEDKRKWTIYFWFVPYSVDNNYLMGKETSWNIEIIKDMLQFNDIIGELSLKSKSEFCVNKLYNVAIVFDLDFNIIKMYVNGTLNNFNETDKPIKRTEDKFLIGKRKGIFYNRLIFNLKILDLAFSDYQCKYNYYHHPLYLYNMGVISHSQVQITDLYY